jgi:hypothetical protein
VPGRIPHEAVTEFLGPLKQALRVLDGHAQLLVAKRGSYRKDVPYVWILNDEEGMLLRGFGRLHATMRFMIIDCDPETTERGDPLRVTTLGYNYKIANLSGQDLIRFHWHPYGAGQNPHPHVHALPDLNAHFYMPRTTLEAVVRHCVELDAPLTMTRAEAITHLAQTEAAHLLHRSWVDYPPGHEGPFRLPTPRRGR